MSGPVRRIPLRLLPLMLVVEAAAASVVVAGLVLTPVDSQSVLLALLLAGLGAVHTELAVGIERARQRAVHRVFNDMAGAWTFAGALLLSPPMAGLVVVGIYAHLWWRVGKPSSAMLYRHLYNTATVVLAAAVASYLVTPELLATAAGAGPDSAAACGGLLGALVLYMVVNHSLVASALILAADRWPGWRRAFGEGDEHVLETATLCLGLLGALSTESQWSLILLALPSLLVLHRAVLVRQLEHRANVDVKTGLLNAVAWHGHARRATDRALRHHQTVAVLVLDLDRFKSVNDCFGHVAGDAVLSVVGRNLLTEVRQCDLVGRFGGEEFVVLLTGLPMGSTARRQAYAAAERIRSRVRSLTVELDGPTGRVTISDLSVSVGVALHGPDGGNVDELMEVADAALYAAKRAGRNQIRPGWEARDLPAT